MILQPGRIQQFTLPDHFRARDRIHPIRLMFASRSTVHLEVDLSPGWSIPPLSHADSLCSEFGRAHWIWEGGGNRLSAFIDYLSGTDEVRPEDYPEFRSFIDGVRIRNLNEIVLSRPEDDDEKDPLEGGMHDVLR